MRSFLGVGGLTDHSVVAVRRRWAVAGAVLLAAALADGGVAWSVAEAAENEDCAAPKPKLTVKVKNFSTKAGYKPLTAKLLDKVKPAKKKRVKKIVVEDCLDPPQPRTPVPSELWAALEDAPLDIVKVEPDPATRAFVPDPEPPHAYLPTHPPERVERADPPVAESRPGAAPWVPGTVYWYGFGWPAGRTEYVYLPAPGAVPSPPPVGVPLPTSGGLLLAGLAAYYARRTVARRG